MSSAPRIDRALAIGQQIPVRLRRIEALLDANRAEIEANQREYEALLEQNHILVSEHDSLRRRLDYGDRRRGC